MKNVISFLAGLALVLSFGMNVSAADMDCSDFSTWQEAQNFFLSAGGPESDPHRLDGSDNDGLACESLPGFDPYSDPDFDVDPGIFTDSGGHWAETDINFLYEQNLIGGYPDGSFGVENGITRAEVAAVIARDLNLPAAEETFPDVTSNYWAADVIGAVAAVGIVGGYPDGTFHPKDAVTRGELASILVRAYHLQGQAKVTFSDVSPDYWGYEAIQALVAENITNGYPDGTFKPNNEVTRAEFAAFLARIIRE